MFAGGADVAVFPWPPPGDWAFLPAVAARRKKTGGLSVELKPADPFELIRWLARTQSDPRKAVAELVQNSLDAGAKHVSVHRLTQRGQAALIIRDDGEGVVPELSREEALRYLASHVGHSRKMGLDAAERARRVVAGKYGVGLLGFWAIGKALELRTRVAGSDFLALRLEEDSPRADIAPLPLRTDLPATFTEAAVLGVHPAAQRLLSGRRLSDYLAAELRGQLLAHAVELVVHDGMARGLAQKRFLVTPRRFTGERLPLPDEIEIPGHPPLRVELYAARGAERPAVQVACAGTLVADDIAELASLGVAEAPWVGCELSGLLDFAGFNVPPGTRRGVAPDRAASLFVGALEELEPLVRAELDRLDRERRAALDQDVVRELKKALRGFRKRLPHYDLPQVDGPKVPGELDASPPPNGERLPDSDSETEPQPPADPLPLLPPGPLTSVRLTPKSPRIAPGGERRLRATALDDAGRALTQGVEYRFEVDPGTSGITVVVDPTHSASCTASAPSHTPAGATALVSVRARAGDRVAVALVTLEVAEGEAPEPALGIPEPKLIPDPEGRWRSRMSGDHWEVNSEHADYVALRADPRGRVRYLLSLIAKEIVLRTSGRPDVAEPLESMIEVLAHAERNLRGG